METNQQSIQSVLLIDICRPDELSDKDICNKYKAIALTSFRILNHLQSSIQCNDEKKSKVRHDTGLRWSYKFFNSKSYKSASKQDKLRDYKLRYFEQFEAKLDDSIQKSNEKVGKTTKIYPAESIQKALTEIVTDIEWETPDIASPMKGRRHSKQQHQHTSGNQNAVFLFTNLPCNSQQMRMFAGKRVLDSDILLDAIMPPHLYEQFCHSSKISLFWIDISSVNISKDTVKHETRGETFSDINCIEIVSKTLDRIRGAALKIENVIDFSHADWQILDSKITNHHQSSKEETVMNAKTGPGKNKQAVSIKSIPSKFPSDAVVKGITPAGIKVREQKLDTNYGKGNLHLKKDGTFQVIALDLKPTSSPDRSPGLTSDKEVANIPVNRNDGRSKLVSVVQPQDWRNLFSSQLDFTVYSSISKSTSLDLRSITGAHCFSAVVNNQGETTEKQLFEDLLKTLNNNDNFLVLSVKSSGGMSIPYLALMDVLTGHTVVIMILPLGATLGLEKACLLQTESCTSEPELNSCCLGNSTLAKLAMVCKQESETVKLTKNQRKKHHKKGSVIVTECYNPQVLNTWHLPGTSKGLPSLINKLNNRLHDLDFLSPEEKQTLKSLQKMYRKDNQPPALQQNSGHQHALRSQTQHEEKATDVTPPAIEVGKRKNSKLNRGLLMVSRSKAAVKRHSKTEEEIEASQTEKPTAKLSVDISNLDLLTEVSLAQYLKDVYTSTLDRGDGLETAVQNMVTVTVHFLKEKGDNPELQAVEMLRRELILSNSALREKYQDKTTEYDKAMKQIEYKLQVLLLLEMESAILSADDSHIEKCADEIVNLLRTLSFVTDSGVVPNFLNKVILRSYAATLPRLLVSVYDELMQPLPDSLAMFASPNKSADLSVLDNSLQSVDSVQDPGSNKSDILQSSRTLRTRRLVQHPSLSDYGSKKQIMVMKKPAAAAKTKDKTKEKEKLKRQRSAQPAAKQKKNKGKEDIVKVRRNLFEGDKPKLERRQSVAVMERTRKSPYKRNLDLSFKSPRATKSPAAKRRSVADTPAHKQMANAVWNRQDNKRKRTVTEEDVEVVQESPMKQMEDNFAKVSPSRNKHAVTMMRRSFYSAGPRSRSRNLTKYFQFADKIAGRQQRLSVGSQPQLHLPHKSPSRSSFLMSQLMGSPSPRHKTPSKASRSSTATTPKHIVGESPYRNTRSKTPLKFSKVLSFDSPKKSLFIVSDEEKINAMGSPNKHHRTPKKKDQVNILCADSPGPITRSQSPKKTFSSPQHSEKHAENTLPASSQGIRIPSTPKQIPHRPSSTPLPRSPSLAPPLTPQRSILKSSHSSKKDTIMELPSTPQRTPKNSNRLVLESPCHNTRSRNFTPSRTSVCTALFMKSPRRTPKSKLFGEIETRSPKRRVHFDSVEEASTSQTEAVQSEVNTSDTQVLQKKQVQSLANISFVNKDGSVTSLCVKSSPNQSHKSNEVQKTPSPRKSQKVTTPESFDKWPRRKRRWASPTQTSSQKENFNVDNERSNSTDQKQSLVQAEDSSSESSQESKRQTTSISRKRSFHESVKDSSTVFSSHKRSKTSWTDSLSSKDMLDTRYSLHQRVISTVSSTGDHSQSGMNSSQASSLDYFSATNDEVFLTGDSQNMDSNFLESSTSSRLHSTRSLTHSTTRSKSPVFGTSPSVSRLLQDCATDPSPSSQGFDICTEADEPLPSPKFETSPVLARAKENKSQIQVSPGSSKTSSSGFVSPTSRSPTSQSKTPPMQSSPYARTSSIADSLHNRKYSPSVSAKSLVHLMNSPLIQPGGTQFHSPNKRDNLSARSAHFKSRKSLNMQK